MVVLGGTEDAGRRIWNIPIDYKIILSGGMNEEIGTNQAASTSRADKNRIRACLIWIKIDYSIGLSIYRSTTDQGDTT
jgi:hypothetical protein